MKPMLETRDFRALAEAAVARMRGGLHGRFDSYAQAAASCRGPGYGMEILAAAVASKTSSYRECLAQDAAEFRVTDTQARLFLALSRAHRPDRETTVVDIGGGCGAHFYEALKLLPSAGFRWFVVETDEMCTAAASSGPPAALHFSSSLEESLRRAAAIDLVLCSGALQYVPDAAGALTAALRSQPRYMLFSRVPVGANQRTFYTVQRTRLSGNGPGPLPDHISDIDIEYPMAVFSEPELRTSFGVNQARRWFFDEIGLTYGRQVGLVSFRSYLVEPRGLQN